MTHHDLQLPKRFSGAHYDHQRDYNSLAGQLGEVYRVLSKGEWMTLGQIARKVSENLHKPVLETSVSANVRNLRKPDCGGLNVETRRNDSGFFEYRMETEKQRRLF